LQNRVPYTSSRTRSFEVVTRITGTYIAITWDYGTESSGTTEERVHKPKISFIDYTFK
jgi:hypothetical protein